MRPQIDWKAIDDALTGGNSVSGEELLVAGATMLVGVLIAWLIGWWRRRRLSRLHDQARQFVGLGARFAQILVIALSAGWALTSLGANIGWLTIVMLVAGFVIVLATRPILEGMGASAALVTRPAFGVGDEIAVDDVVGEVVEITNRSTVIRLRDARRVHIPNVKMLDKTVEVYTVDRLRRSAVDVTVGFECDIDHVEAVLRSALADLETVERVGSIRAEAITGGIQLSVRFWHPSSIQAGNDAVNDAVRTIVATLRREKIRFAPPIDLALVTGPTAPRHDEETSSDE